MQRTAEAEMSPPQAQYLEVASYITHGLRHTQLERMGDGGPLSKSYQKLHL